MKQTFFGLIAILVLMSAGTTSADPGIGWSANKDIVQQYFQKFNSGDIDGVRKTFTPDGEVEGVMGWGTVDSFLPIWKQKVESLGIHLTVDEIISEGDFVAVRLTEKGISRAPFFGHPATGKLYQLFAMEWFEIKDGKIRRRWAARDAASQARQLGWNTAAGAGDVKLPAATR